MKRHFIFIILTLTSILVQAQSENVENGFEKTKNLKVIKHKGKYYLSIFKKNNYRTVFDKIELDENYAFCKKNNLFTIISEKSGKLILNNVRAYFTVGNKTRYYQLLKNNDIIWLDLNSKITTLRPTTSLLNVVCGTVTQYRNFIHQFEDSSTITFEEIDESGNKKLDTTFDITKYVGKKSITFLNNSKILDFDANFTFKKNLDKTIFYEKQLDGTFNIFKLDINKQIQKLVLVRNIENKYDLANRQNYFNQFIYTQNKLYGYFPMNLKAKYLFLNPLNLYFARFMYPSGIKGWIDVNGTEYLDK